MRRWTTFPWPSQQKGQSASELVNTEVPLLVTSTSPPRRNHTITGNTRKGGSIQSGPPHLLLPSLTPSPQARGTRARVPCVITLRPVATALTRTRADARKNLAPIVFLLTATSPTKTSTDVGSTDTQIRNITRVGVAQVQVCWTGSRTGAAASIHGSPLGPRMEAVVEV